MPGKKRISRAELMSELERKLAGSDAPELNRDMQRLSLQSAAFLLGEPKKAAEADMLDLEQTELLSGQIMRKTDPNYMEWNYGSLSGSETEKRFEGMLLLTADSLTLPKGVDLAGKKAELHRRIEARGPTYAEYLLMNTRRTPGPAEYREKDELDCTGPLPAETCRVFTALTHCMCRNAGLPALQGTELDREARVYSGMPLCLLTLRNRRTAEMLERREFGSVAAALKSTRDAFQFSEKADFQAAQRDMKRLAERMKAREYPGEQGKKWNALRQAARGFTGARYRINNADAVNSSRLLLAAESFLLEGKHEPGDPGVELALAALSVGVPDAPRNPGVRALTDSMNARRGTGEPPFSVPDRGAPSVAAPRREPRTPQAEAAPAALARESGIA
ncbi:MAG: hypothetical protein IKP17_05100 [Oscillospiraceae bacterium]|nr:hypothetical protein [Oscillospiraceae bacterium]